MCQTSTKTPCSHPTTLGSGLSRTVLVKSQKNVVSHEKKEFSFFWYVIIPISFKSFSPGLQKITFTLILFSSLSK